MSVLPDIELPQTRPSCENCIAWSADGEIAVAAYDHVVLLVPVHNQGDKIWEILRLRINEFAESEWPYRLPQPFVSMSIGEEQSFSHVTGLDWSPPGLGLHQRCVLAVLTSNHLLSIWACNANPRVQSCWKRVLVVNQADTRIISFAWDQSNAESFSLAVGQDPRDLHIVSIISPFSSDVEAWAAQPLCHQALPPTRHLMPPSLFQREMDKRVVFEIRYYRNGRLGVVCLNKQCEYVVDKTSIRLADAPGPMPRIQHQWQDKILELQTRVGSIAGKDARLIEVLRQGHARFGDIICTTMMWQISDEITFKSRAEETTLLVFEHQNLQHTTTTPWLEEPEIRPLDAFRAILQAIVVYLGHETSPTIADIKIAYSTVMSMILDDFDADVLRLCAALLQQLADLLHTDLQTEQDLVKSLGGKSRPEHVPSLNERTTMLRNRALELEGVSTAFLLDRCPIMECASIIGWFPHGEALCLEGHPFGRRCSITSLPLRECGISKYCSGCDRSALNEQILVAAWVSSGGPGRRPAGLAMHLLRTFCICPFCHRKYFLRA